MERDIDRILFTEDAIRVRVESLADEILERFAGRDLTLVCILKGSVVFAADLIRRLPVRLHLGFVTARSYGDGTTAGDLHIGGLDTEPLDGRTVLVVDEIIDTGRTLEGVVASLREAGAPEASTCVLVAKRARRAVAMEADLCGFVIEDEFVVGYGLDYAGEYRNLPFIGVLRGGVLREERLIGRS